LAFGEKARGLESLLSPVSQCNPSTAIAQKQGVVGKQQSQSHELLGALPSRQPHCTLGTGCVLNNNHICWDSWVVGYNREVVVTPWHGSDSAVLTKDARCMINCCSHDGRTVAFKLMPSVLDELFRLCTQRQSLWPSACLVIDAG
jgi:membrane peptidoglycan carboxypeptidase